MIIRILGFGWLQFEARLRYLETELCITATHWSLHILWLQWVSYGEVNGNLSSRHHWVSRGQWDR